VKHGLGQSKSGSEQERPEHQRLPPIATYRLQLVLDPPNPRLAVMTQGLTDPILSPRVDVLARQQDRQAGRITKRGRTQFAADAFDA
jgi:hypothetical protein